MDPIFLLAITTFALFLGFLWWSYSSTKRNQETGGKTAGIGGPNDPLAGATPGIRKPDELRAALNAMHDPKNK
ncbi:MAG: hypothetical protein U1E70_11585 [Acetobacteraceae bacterium]|nr:hypothetical protein [Pseudomonadota bacterium]